MALFGRPTGKEEADDRDLPYFEVPPDDHFAIVSLVEDDLYGLSYNTIHPENPHYDEILERLTTHGT